jgi:hypothetical protein
LFCLLKKDSVPWSQYALLRLSDVECDELGEVREDAAVTYFNSLLRYDIDIILQQACVGLDRILLAQGTAMNTAMNFISIKGRRFLGQLSDCQGDSVAGILLSRHSARGCEEAQRKR